MGGSTSVVTGYKYNLGVHFALCLGPIDKLRRITVDKKDAWQVGIGTPGRTPEDEVETGWKGIAYDAVATPEAGDEDGARIEFDGIVPVGIGREYYLRFGDGSTVTVTILEAQYSGDDEVTVWHVEPDSLSWSAQDIGVLDKAEVDAAGAESPASTAGGQGRLRIDAPELFGGESREGGVVGDLDLLLGAPDQGANDYLQGVANEDVPAFRGVTSVVLRQVYLGLNYYLKPWAFEVTRIHVHDWDGEEQWYDEKAAIAVDATEGDGVKATYYWNNAATSPGLASPSRLVLEVDPADTIRISKPSVAEDANMLWDAYSLYPDDADNGGETWTNQFWVSHAWVSSPLEDTIYSNHFGGHVATSAEALSIAQGKTPKELTGFDTYIFHIYEDPVPGGNRGGMSLKIEVLGESDDALDINPAHDIREVLTSTEYGGGYAGSEIDDTSFTAAADTLYAEGLGISSLWQREGPWRDYVAEVLAVIDGACFISRRTGKWKLKLIRDDYDVLTLPVFDEAGVADWGDISRRDAVEAVNGVTVIYADHRRDGKGSVTVHDVARRQMFGANVAPVEYPMIRHESLATRLAERDLRALSSPLLSGEVTLNRGADDLEPGDPFILYSERRGINAVMRVVEIGQGDGRSNGIRVVCVEDAFALGTEPVVGGEQDYPGDFVSLPAPLERRVAEEAPYWLLVQRRGHQAANDMLASDPDAGQLLVGGERPSQDAFSAQVWTDAGGGYARDGSAQFVPTAVTTATLSDDPTATTVAVEEWTNMALAQPGQIASLGAELVRIDSVSASSVTLGRGLLDTVPIAHGSGEVLVVWGALASINETEFTAGEAVSVKLRPYTGLGTLPLNAAPADAVGMDSRAIRPLPVGAFQADGGYSIDEDALTLDDVELTWAHRDRLAQTSPVLDDYTAGDIGPEAGVSYWLTITWIDPETDEAHPAEGIEISLGTATAHTLTAADFGASRPSGVTQADISVRARRDTGGVTYEDWGQRVYRLDLPTLASGWGFDWGNNWGSPSS